MPEEMDEKPKKHFSEQVNTEKNYAKHSKSVDDHEIPDTMKAQR
jgi:hypothetical protein